MAVVFATGFESGVFASDGITNNGGANQSTLQARTGTYSARCNPSSGAGAGFFTTAGTSFGYMHFGLYIATNPTVERRIYGAIATGTINVRLASTGALNVYVNTTLIGTSAVLSTSRWYWIGIRSVASVPSVVWLQIDGFDSVSGAATVTAANNLVGPVGSEASACDLYFDDMIVDGAGFVPPSRVSLLLPTADSAVGTGWTLGTGTAISANGFDSVNNTPPVGVADLAVGSDPKQIRNASANANTNYDATLATYTSVGVSSNDTVLAVWPVTATAAPVVTNAKQGTIGLVSNPTITNVALGSGGTAGAFWSGTAAGTYTTGWKISFGTMTTSPSITPTTAPVIRITQVDSSTRIAIVCFLGLVVAWTPNRVPFTTPLPPVLAR